LSILFYVTDKNIIYDSYQLSYIYGVNKPSNILKKLSKNKC